MSENQNIDGTEGFEVSLDDGPEPNKTEDEGESVEASKEEEEVEEKQPKPKKNRAQARIQNLSRRNKELEAELEALRAERQKDESEEDGEEDGGEDGEEDEEEDGSNDEVEEPEQVDDEWKEIVESIDVKFDSARDKYEDFDEKVRGDFTLTQSMVKALNELDDPGEVAYHLANNPKEADKIGKLSEVKQAVELSKLEVKLTAPKPTKKAKSTKAPAPVEPVGGEGEINKSLENMDFAEFENKRNAETKNRSFW